MSEPPYPDDVVTPFYYVSSREYGLIAGPVGSQSDAREIAERFGRVYDDVVIASRDTHEVAKCHRCGKRMDPGRAGRWSSGRFSCHECSKQTWNWALSSWESHFGSNRGELQLDF